MLYDDNGKIITEDEIKMKMGYTYLTGCGCLGISLKSLGYLGLGISVVGGSLASMFGNLNYTVGYLGCGIASLATILVGYRAPLLGKHIEREIAIKKIKEQRRIQKQNEDKKSFVPESKITLPLLSGSF
jgi:hypothetical protein